MWAPPPSCACVREITYTIATAVYPREKPQGSEALNRNVSNLCLSVHHQGMDDREEKELQRLHVQNQIPNTFETLSPRDQQDLLEGSDDRRASEALGIRHIQSPLAPTPTFPLPIKSILHLPPPPVLLLRPPLTDQPAMLQHELEKARVDLALAVNKVNTQVQEFSRQRLADDEEKECQERELLGLRGEVESLRRENLDLKATVDRLQQEQNQAAAQQLFYVVQGQITAIAPLALPPDLLQAPHLPLMRPTGRVIDQRQTPLPAGPSAEVIVIDDD